LDTKNRAFYKEAMLRQTYILALFAESIIVEFKEFLPQWECVTQVLNDLKATDKTFSCLSWTMRSTG